MGVILIATGIWFYVVYQDDSNFSMYMLEKSNICLLFYFVFMLLGAKMGIVAQTIISKPYKDTLFLLLHVLLFYVLIIFSRKHDLIYLQLYSLIPLVLVVYYLYKVCNSKWSRKLYCNKAGHFFIRFIGGLCLEIYLIQRFALTDTLNSIFPLNILIIFVTIFVMAYLTRCIASFFSQTFKDEPYSWTKIIEKY